MNFTSIVLNLNIENIVIFLQIILNVKTITVVSSDPLDENNGKKLFVHFSKHLIYLNLITKTPHLPGYREKNVMLLNPSDSDMLKYLSLKPENIIVLGWTNLKDALIPSETQFYEITKFKNTWKIVKRFRPIRGYKEKVCQLAGWETGKQISVENSEKNCTREILENMKGVRIKIASLTIGVSLVKIRLQCTL